MSSITERFPITETDYQLLEDQFEDLCNYQSWQLIRKNSRNNHTNDQEDVAQEMRIALLEAGSYYKRQTYIESCLKACKEFSQDKFINSIIEELWFLWKNKTRHGARRQKFGLYQENLLDKLVLKIVPEDKRPNPNQPLKLNTEFRNYAKSVTWNRQKNIGKRITREKSIRTGLVSLSEYDYLSGM